MSLPIQSRNRKLSGTSGQETPAPPRAGGCRGQDQSGQPACPAITQTADTWCPGSDYTGVEQREEGKVEATKKE